MTFPTEEQTALPIASGSQEQIPGKKRNTEPQKPRVAAVERKAGKKGTHAKKAAKRPKGATAGKDAASGQKPVAPRQVSKTAKVLELLHRSEGATLKQIIPYASHCTSLAW